MNELLELKRLNDTEVNVIIAGLKEIAVDKKIGWAASALLEDDARFVRGLFWTSKEGR